MRKTLLNVIQDAIVERRWLYSEEICLRKTISPWSS